MVGNDFSGIRSRKTDDLSWVLWFDTESYSNFTLCEICIIVGKPGESEWNTMSFSLLSLIFNT